MAFLFFVQQRIQSPYIQGPLVVMSSRDKEMPLCLEFCCAFSGGLEPILRLAGKTLLCVFGGGGGEKTLFCGIHFSLFLGNPPSEQACCCYRPVRQQALTVHHAALSWPSHLDTVAVQNKKRLRTFAKCTASLKKTEKEEEEEEEKEEEGERERERAREREREKIGVGVGGGRSELLHLQGV